MSEHEVTEMSVSFARVWNIPCEQSSVAGMPSTQWRVVSTRFGAIKVPLHAVTSALLSSPTTAVVFVWCVGLAGLAVLFARLPRTTWPEQLGLAGGLFGAAVAGGWWLALPVVAVARAVWLGRRLVR